MTSLTAAKEALFNHLQGMISDQDVLQAFQQVPREAFIPKTLQAYSYEDRPLPIGAGQTISQPTTVLLMTQHLDVHAGQKILEIGTGSGYQAALLSVLVGKKGRVITTEIIQELFQAGKQSLRSYTNVKVVHADGSQGYRKEAPYDRIMVTAACPKAPLHLLQQLTKDGLLLAPVGDSSIQQMLRFRKDGRSESFGDFLFVPLTGKHGFV